MHKQAGLTLIELMTTLTLVAIVMAMATPMFQNMMMRNRLTAHVNSMTATMNLAKSEAALRGTDVAVCARSTDTTCDVAGDWTNGWLVYVDPDADGVLAAAADVVRVFGPLNESANATAKDSGGSVETVFRFTTDGLARIPVKYEFEHKSGSTSYGKRCFELLRGGSVIVSEVGC